MGKNSRVVNLGLRALGTSVLRSSIASAAMGVALLALLYVWHHDRADDARGEGLLLCIAVPLGGAVYTGWAYLAGASELTTVWAMTRRRLGRIR